MKKKGLLKIGATVLALAMGVACFTGCGGGLKVPDFTETANIKIGASGPLTGGAAIYGIAVENGAKLAVKEINDNGGINGMNFSFEMYDDVHNADNVATNYATLKERGMQVSLGCVTSGPCLAFKEEAISDNLFVLTPSATSDEVPQNASNVYQMCFSDSGQGVGAANFIVANYPTAKLGVFYKSDDVYSSGIYNQFMANYTGDKTAITVTSFNDANATDFSTQLNALKDCTFIFMPIYYQAASLFMTQAQDTTLSQDAIFFGCDGFDGIEGYEGFNVDAIPQEISYLSHFDSGAKTGLAKTFIDSYVDNFGSDTLNQFGASAYDCVYAIKAAIEQAISDGVTINGSTTIAQMTTALKAVFNGGFTFTGVTGNNVTWNADGTVNKTPVKYVVND